MNELPVTARCYLLIVGISGAGLLAWLVRNPSPISHHGVLVMFCVLTVLGELRLIRAPLGPEGIDLTFSTAFAFALLLGFGMTYAAVATVAASMLSDLTARKSWWKTMFNCSQFVLVTVASGGAFWLIAGKPHVDPSQAFSSKRDLMAAVVAALVYHAANTGLLSGAISLAQRAPFLRLIRQESTYQVIGSLAMFGLAPVALVVAARTLWLVPVLLIPLGVAYRTTNISIEKEHQALHDSLTGLANRVLFRHRAIESIDHHRGDRDAASAVMLIDLDRFKEINDTLGHSVGDLVLQTLGPRLLAAVGESGLVARLGGDEFGVVLDEVASLADARAAANRVLEAIREPIEVEGLALEVNASVGIAAQGHHGDDADTLIRHADIAMYSAKETRSGQAMYTAFLDHNSPMQLTLVSELRQAITSSTLLVHYQPKVLVPTGVACGAEALVRWQHPIRGLIHPDEFIPVAEQSGLIRELTEYVLGEAIAASARWRRMGHDLSINVNLSPRTLHNLDLPALVAMLIEREDVPPSKVVLEITETTIMAEPETAIAALQELRSIGVQVSMDDYGVGHSSLSQLKLLPIDELKIDKSFITHMTAESSDALIVASTVDLARKLGLRVVAEGVETPHVWDLLNSMECDQAQGYYFSRPVPEAEFIDWIAANRRRASAGQTFEPLSELDTDDLDWSTACS